MAFISDELKGKMWEFYKTRYMLLLLLPLALVLLSFVIIGIHFANTGDFISKDVSLKGGVSLTIPLSSEPDTAALTEKLKAQFTGHDVSARGFGSGDNHGVSISADIDINNKEDLALLLDLASSALGIELIEGQYGIEFFGSSLGESFFRESLIILLISFLFMSLVVFVYFRNFIPSIAIVLAALGDMIVALAFVDFFSIPIGTAGIAAFLMLIAYSVDTDILLTIRVLKRKEGTVEDRIKSSIVTGMTQTLTAIAAMSVGFFLSPSEIIRQIMLILIVGLSADIIFTWIQNVAMLRYYLEKKGIHQSREEKQTHHISTHTSN